MSETKEQSPLRILLAEDDAISAHALSRHFQEWGYDVITTPNGDEAWKIICEGDIRLAVLDWMMPGIEGVELCRRIRQSFDPEKGRYIYIILITGRTEQDDIIKGLSAGADDYITKPYHFMELKVRIQNGERIVNLEEERLRMASTDDLTHIWNRKRIRRFFSEEFNRSRRTGRPLGLILADIDRFKLINDTRGHPVGDRILQITVERLQSCIRSYDKIGRYGGDEFFIVLPDCGRDSILEVASRLQKAVVGEPMTVESLDLAVTVSMGAASTEELPDLSEERIIAAADQALYKAKESGRNTFVAATLENVAPIDEKK